MARIMAIEDGAGNSPRRIFANAVDRSENISFNSFVESVPSFDLRSELELRRTSLEALSPLEREKAVWELAFRLKENAFIFLRQVFSLEPVAEIRWNILWLATKVCQERAPELLQDGQTDAHREVRDWANLFLSEIQGQEFKSEYQQGAICLDATFDQTLPLQIAGYAIINVPGIGYTRATLSPLWFEHIMGRVLACTNRSTIETDLVIEKKLTAYEGGEDHFEIFKFGGVSWPSSPATLQHRYESYSQRNFYFSGKVKDRTQPMDSEVPVILNRAAETTMATLLVRPADREKPTNAQTGPRLAGAGAGGGDGTGYDSGASIRLLNGQVVRTVRGQFFGWASTSLKHYSIHQDVLPGTVQLANPLYPTTAGLVNTYLCGTFRGKLGERSGGDIAAINLIPCHGTTNGELDLDLDGRADVDPLA